MSSIRMNHAAASSRLEDVAADLCRCALAGVVKAEPNWLTARAAKAGQHPPDVVAMHPAFFGCYDWHSAVHSHWLLARLLAIDEQRLLVETNSRKILPPELSVAAEAILDAHLSRGAMEAEAATLAGLDDSFELPCEWNGERLDVHHCCCCDHLRYLAILDGSSTAVV